VIELVNRAEKFCSKIEVRLADAAPLSADENIELRSKLGFCRNQIAHLRTLGDLTMQNPVIREGIRHLVIGLMWVAFYARSAIDFKLYRMLLTIESTFTYLLMEQVPKYRRNGHISDSRDEAGD